MITVTLEDLKDKFDGLINEKISREEIYNWALEKEEAYDNDLLVFYPDKYKPIIWDGVDYLLTVVDSINLDGSYLYGNEDFIDYQKKLFNDRSFHVKDLFDRHNKFREAEKEVIALEEKYPNQSDKFYMEKTDKILEKKGLIKRLN